MASMRAPLAASPMSNTSAAAVRASRVVSEASNRTGRVVMAREHHGRLAQWFPCCSCGAARGVRLADRAPGRRCGTVVLCRPRHSMLSDRMRIAVVRLRHRGPVHGLAAVAGTRGHAVRSRGAARRPHAHPCGAAGRHHLHGGQRLHRVQPGELSAADAAVRRAARGLAAHHHELRGAQ